MNKDSRGESQTKTFEALYGGRSGINKPRTPKGTMLDFSEIEMRVLAHMREDAEKMDDTDSFRRPDDLEGYDTTKIRTLLSLKDAEKILNEEGCQKPDIHKTRAAEMFDVAEEDVTDEQRRFAKVFNFRDMYNGNNNIICDLIDAALVKARRSIG